MAWLLLFLVAFASDQSRFETIVRDSLAACVPDLELTSVNCDAEPCVAVFSDDQGDWGALANCAEWRDAYGSTVSTMAGHASCSDGRKLPYLLVAPDGGDSRAFGRVKAVRKVFPCGPKTMRPGGGL